MNQLLINVAEGGWIVTAGSKKLVFTDIKSLTEAIAKLLEPPKSEGSLTLK